ncbi:MAG TPA: choice-of-anchor tandem repeat GloVer-containing protein [Verrucomicrobiae bacterium]
MPNSDLTVGTDGNLYGITYSGGISNRGTIFAVATNGSLTTLALFQITNGANPRGAMLLGSNGQFYGTTSLGGVSNCGTIFSVTTNGILISLASFRTTNGANPEAALTLGLDGRFYGTTYAGGISNSGTIFAVSTNGTLTNLASFRTTNGANPEAAMTFGPDGRFYGTTYAGGISNSGTIFAVSTNGTLTNLASFRTTNGANPEAAMTFGPDGRFYGATYAGGISNSGTIFAVTTNGLLTNLVSFRTTNGANPQAVMILGSDGSFYGTTKAGGLARNGTIFRVTTNGLLTTVLSFVTANGSAPNGELVVGNDANLYGSTTSGGTNGTYGTIFKISSGGNFSTIFSFSGSNGSFPQSWMISGPDGNLYGSTFTGGTHGGYGTVYELTTNDVFTSLCSFANTNGASPFGGLTFGSDGAIYGATAYGGDLNVFSGLGGGTLFRLATNRVLSSLFIFSNIYSPNGELYLANDGSFYGTTEEANGANQGTVFNVTTNGVLTILATLEGYVDAGLTFGLDGNFYGTTQSGTIFKMTPAGQVTNFISFAGTNGGDVDSGLLLGPDGYLYGTTQSGGEGGGFSGYGTVYQASTNGILTTLFSFGYTNGADPFQSGVVLGPDGNLYGTTSKGGPGGGGTVFQIRTCPYIICQPLKQAVVIGSTATFNVIADGLSPYCYQWLENGTNLTDDGNILGSTTDTLTLTNISTFDIGNYSVVISNAFGTVTSSVASLQIIPNILMNSNNGGFQSNGFGFNISSSAGSTLIVESSTNLIDWLQIATLTNEAGSILFVDPATNQQSEFYRVYQP